MDLAAYGEEDVAFRKPGAHGSCIIWCGRRGLEEAMSPRSSMPIQVSLSFLLPQHTSFITVDEIATLVPLSGNMRRADCYVWISIQSLEDCFLYVEKKAKPFGQTRRLSDKPLRCRKEGHSFLPVACGEEAWRSPTSHGSLFIWRGKSWHRSKTRKSSMRPLLLPFTYSMRRRKRFLGEASPLLAACGEEALRRTRCHGSCCKWRGRKCH